MTPREWAEKLFGEVWFLKEDKKEIIAHIEAALIEAIVDHGGHLPSCPHDELFTNDYGYIACKQCGDVAGDRPCGICNSRFCKCNEYGLR